MSREIKFRVICENHDRIEFYTLGDLICGSALSSNGEGFFKSETWSQYTGLKDKNGKEIYEHDIVKCDGKQRTIKWANGKFWFVAEVSNQHEDISELFNNYYDKVEVIGNIHQNPLNY